MSSDLNQGLHRVGLDEVRRNWGCFLGLGIIVVILGLIALGWSVLVTLASVEVFGWFLLFGGVLTAVHAFWRRAWGGFFFDLLAGILYVVVGLLIATHPVKSAEALTLLIAVFLM